jgi:translation initiation factor 1
MNLDQITYKKRITINMKRKKRIGIVYSTNPDFVYETDNIYDAEELPVCQQQLYIWLDKKGRNGKMVTLIKGFLAKREDLDDLARELKIICGSGGSVKEGQIIVQGDFRDKIMTYLLQIGYKVKKAGS